MKELDPECSLIPVSGQAGLSQLDPRLFLWNAEADYVRVPKSVMEWLTFAEEDSMASVGAVLDAERTFARGNGRLSAALLGALGLSAPELQALQAHRQSHFEAYRAFATSSGYLADRWRIAFEAGLAQLAGEERARIILRSARLDGSLSQHFQKFGAEDLMIVATPAGRFRTRWWITSRIGATPIRKCLTNPESNDLLALPHSHRLRLRQSRPLATAIHQPGAP